MLDKKQVLVIFLFEFKMDRKAVETNCNIHNAFGSGTADECIVVQDVLQRSWEPWRWGTHWLVIGSWQQLRAIIEGDSLTTTWEVAKELSVDCSMVFWHLKQDGNVRKLGKWVPLELTQKSKKCCFKVSSSFILCNKSESFLNWIVIGRKVDCIWQPGTTSLEVGPRSSKVLLKAKLAPKKCHGHCSVACRHLIQ